MLAIEQEFERSQSGSTTVALRYSLNLSKPELIGVLKLATVWEMKEVCEIHAFQPTKGLIL